MYIILSQNDVIIILIKLLQTDEIFFSKVVVDCFNMEFEFFKNKLN